MIPEPARLTANTNHPMEEWSGLFKESPSSPSQPFHLMTPAKWVNFLCQLENLKTENSSEKCENETFIGKHYRVHE